MKTLKVFLITIVVLIGLVGCSQAPTQVPESNTSTNTQSVAEPSPQATSGGLIGVIPKSTLYDYWKMIRLGAEKAAGENGYEIRYQGTATDTDTEGQIKIVEDFVTAGVKAIVISPVNPDALAVALEAIPDTIPVIVMDGRLNSTIQKTTVSTNNYDAASIAADKMAGLIGSEGGLVAVVSEVPGSVQGTDRENGFIDKIKTYPNFEVLEIFYSEGDRTKAANITQDILTEHPDIKGIFATNEGAAVGVSLTIRNEDRKDVVVIGYDSSMDLIQAIYDEVLDGTIAQDPFNIGYTSTIAALDALNGKALPDKTDVPIVYVDLNNVHDPDVIHVLDPLQTLNLK